MIKTLNDLIKITKTVDEPVVGVGVNAFNRLGPAKLFKNYQIVSLTYNNVDKLIEKDVRILSIEKRIKKYYEKKRNTLSILREETTLNFLGKLENPYLFFYRISGPIEMECIKNKWGMIGVPLKNTEIRKKTELRKLAKKLEIPTIPGEIVNLPGVSYRELNKKYGKFVIQLPKDGGGKGTFLIEDENDMKSLEGEVIVSKFIEGSTPSITGCVTRHGILSSELRNQIIDVESCMRKGSFGSFCGHDWCVPIKEEIRRKAYEYADKIGNHLQKTGFKGIFGLDFVCDGKELYLVECNPRLLGTYPVYTMLQLVNREPPLIAFHIMEFLDIDYKMDRDEVNRKIKKSKKGSHIILSNRTETMLTNTKELKAGVYCYENGLKFLRPGYDISEIKNENEFMLTESVPFKGYTFKPNQRILKIMSASSMTKNNRLNERFTAIVREVYSSMGFKPV